MGRDYGVWYVDAGVENHVCAKPDLVDAETGTLKLPIWIPGPVLPDGKGSPLGDFIGGHIILKDVLVDDSHDQETARSLISEKRLEAEGIMKAGLFSPEPPRVYVYRDERDESNGGVLLVGAMGEDNRVHVLHPVSQDRFPNWYKLDEKNAQVDREQLEAETEGQDEAMTERAGQMLAAAETLAAAESLLDLNAQRDAAGEEVIWISSDDDDGSTHRDAVGEGSVSPGEEIVWISSDEDDGLTHRDAVGEGSVSPGEEIVWISSDEGDGSTPRARQHSDWLIGEDDAE